MNKTESFSPSNTGDSGEDYRGWEVSDHLFDDAVMQANEANRIKEENRIKRQEATKKGAETRK